MKKLWPNTLEGLKWGLSNFDGVEFDIRLTKDQKLVIHHDPYTESGKLVSQMNMNQIAEEKLFLFEELLTDDDFQNKVNSDKYLWIELKADCVRKKPIDSTIAIQLYDQLMFELDESNFPRKNLRILSFSKELLKPVARDEILPSFPIIPYINECNQKYVKLRGLPRVLYKSLKSHMEDCLEDKTKGVLFAREYILGLFSLRHPSYSKLIDLMDELDLELGSNLGRIELERDFSKFHRFTDKTQIYPRYSKPGEGTIIAHRGTGTKGVLIDK